ncbi:MAG TPA: sugar-binding protein [Polyangiaceae bacterium]|nr:sugar-binding protein [Polyangiaceae bacterium]
MLGLGSCIFELPELESQGAGGSAGLPSVGGSPGAGGGPPDQGGTGNIGGSAGSVIEPPPCASGEKLCGDGECRPDTPQYGCSSSACEPCGQVANAVVGCRDGQCAVLNCLPGMADCDGDVLNDSGDVAGNGCEYSLGTPAPALTTMTVPFAHIQVDGSRDDWSAVPSYALEKVCSNCKDEQTEPVSADSSVPPRSDLDARFRVAWDADKFYVLVEAFDNQLFSNGVATGRCQHPAECEDAVQVFLLGRDDRSHDYFNDNQRVFLGLSGRVGAPGQGQPAASDVEVVPQVQGNFCYRIEAQVDWAYTTFTKNNGSAPGHFPPAPNQSYGFDIAVTDWDAPIADENAIQRQSQIFWSDPGTDLVKTEGIDTMTLLGGADAGQ